MKNVLIPLLLIFAGCASTSQVTYQTSTDELIGFSGQIETAFLQKHLEVIAHDSLEGRDTGMPGQKAAAEYLAAFYSEIGMAPKGGDGSYFQHFELDANLTDSLVYATFRVEGGDTLKTDRSVLSAGSTGSYYNFFGGAEANAGQVIFAGFGVTDEDRGVLHLDGLEKETEKPWLLLFEDIPHVVNGDTLINPGISSNLRLGTLLRNYDLSGILLIGETSAERYDELALIQSKIATQPQNLSLPYLDSSRRGGGLPAGVHYISPHMASQILGLDDADALGKKRDQLIETIRDFRPVTTSHYLDYTPYRRAGTVDTENVIAYLEGADPGLKEEVLVLMAHYDHVGIGSPDATGDVLYNGADDNGSGTVSLMAIAHTLAQAREQGYKPKRSILFLHVSAEEVGLLGSRYYSDHPVIPIENTVANFNADMIGRSDPENIRAGNTDYVYLIGGEIISSGLDSLVVAANENSVNMRLDRKYNDLTDSNQFYRRSDHWNFGRLSVPFVFFFTGVHEDYHRPSDTVDKIEFDKYTRVVQLIYTSSIKVANYEGRPEVDNQQFIEITNQMPR